MMPSLRKVLRITLAWIVIALAESAHTLSAMAGMDFVVPPAHARLMFTTAFLAGASAGLTGGFCIVYLFTPWLRRRPYGEALLRLLVTYTALFVAISILTGVYFHSRELHLSLFHPATWKAMVNFYADYGSIRSYLFWLFVVLLTTVTLLVDEKYGPGVFRDFLLGRYFRPRREERVFMFLDLRNSTGLAEQLGEEAFFRLIQELFRDITPSILKHRGEIYQYVGDEVIVSWPPAQGLNEGRCINCFIDIQRALRARSGQYESAYGVRPEFKAGLHYGFVMAGEVGVVKREIAFSGDVLNTTSRIQSICNELGVDVLLSETLVKALPPALQQAAQAIGAFPLRGKAGEMKVYTVGAIM